MSTVHLIIGRVEDATKMAKGPLKKWPNLAIDPIDNVSLAKLFVLLTGGKYRAIIGSFTKVTPDQPELEPWDFENRIFPIYSIPEQYVRSLVDLRDENLLSLATEWNKIEEFQWYKFDPKDLVAQLSSFREFAASCIEKKLALLIYLAP